MNQAITPGPWKWVYEDQSIATLTHLGQDGIDNHVLSVTICESCQSTHTGWEWGRCYTAKKEDAKVLEKSWEMLQALEGLVADMTIMYQKWGIDSMVGVKTRLEEAREILDELK